MKEEIERSLREIDEVISAQASVKMEKKKTWKSSKARSDYHPHQPHGACYRTSFGWSRGGRSTDCLHLVANQKRKKRA